MTRRRKGCIPYLLILPPGTTAISLSAAVLVHSAGSVDLGELAVYRDLKSNENAL